MKLITLFSFIILSLPLTGWAQDTAYVYVIAGQSNTGAAWIDNTLDPFPEDSTHYLSKMTGKYIFCNAWDTSYYGLDVPRWREVECGRNTAMHDPVYYSNRYGFETSFAYYMPANTYILKYSRGSAAIDYFKGETNHFYLTQIYRGFGQLKTLGKIPKLKAYIWNQGESDCTTLEKSQAYYVSLDSLFTQFEREYVRICNIYDWPIDTATYEKIIFQTRNVCTYKDTVEQRKQLWVSDNANAYYFPSTKYKFRYDSLHYTGLEYLEMGIDLYNYFNP